MSKSKSKTEKTYHITVKRVVIFLIISAIICGIGFGFKPQIETYINKTDTEEETIVVDENGLVVHFIDVGQGDSIAIELPDNRTMLIDAGPSSGTEKLMNYLNNTFFDDDYNTFDYVILTHSDEDHCGGMKSVLDAFTVNKIFRPKIYSSKVSGDSNGTSGTINTCTSNVYAETITAFNNEGCDVVFTDIEVMNGLEQIVGTNYSFNFYAPTKDYYSAVNDYSPICVLTYNNKKLMFTGDASTTSENLAINNSVLPDVDLLKVGHHGSKTSTGEDFLNIIKPEIAVIQVGEGNKFGHPTTETLNRLSYINASIYRNDQNGNIVANVTSDIVASINMFCDYANEKIYVHIEYLIAGAVVFVAILCFSSKTTKVVKGR